MREPAFHDLFAGYEVFDAVIRVFGVLVGVLLGLMVEFLWAWLKGRGASWRMFWGHSGEAPGLRMRGGLH